MIRCPVTLLLTSIASPETNKIIEVGSGTVEVGTTSGDEPGVGVGVEPGVGPVVGLIENGVICGGTKTIGGGLSPWGIRNGIAAAPINRNQNFGL